MMDAELVISDLENFFTVKKNTLLKEKDRIEAQLEQLTKIEWDMFSYFEGKKKEMEAKDNEND